MRSKLRNSSKELNKKSKEKDIQQHSSRFDSFFEKYYSNIHLLLIIPIFLVILSIVTITQAINEDGTMIYRDISLKGGLSVTLTSDEINQLSIQQVQELLETNFPQNEFSIQELQIQAQKGGFIIDTNLDEEVFLEFLNTQVQEELQSPNDYTTSYIAPSLSQAFFSQALYTLLISFVLMTVVIFFFFRRVVPSLAIIISILFDIIVTIGILNLFGVHISIAGIGALLMLIGYSIDTDILLTNRVIKEEKARRMSNEEHFKEKFKESFQTGMLMGITTLSAATVALLVTNSQIIYQITLIIIIGLIVDMISTWIQNAYILRKWYTNSKK